MTLTTGKKDSVPKARYAQVKREYICCIKEKNNMTFWVLTFIAEMLEVKGTLYFFLILLWKKEMADIGTDIDFFLFIAECFIWQQSQGAWIGMLKCIPDYTGYVFPESGLL